MELTWFQLADTRKGRKISTLTVCGHVSCDHLHRYTRFEARTLWAFVAQPIWPPAKQLTLGWRTLSIIQDTVISYTIKRCARPGEVFYNTTVCMQRQRSVCSRHTCDLKPHRNIRGLRGDDAHHVCHRVALHHWEGEGGFLEKQRSRVGRQIRLGNPLDVQAAAGGFLRTAIVDGFDLRAR